MALGYVVGKLYLSKHSEQRKKSLMVSGVVMLGLLFILRLLVGYGDPQAWQIFGDTGLTLMSVFNVTKYPFSLQFVLMTLSVAFFYLSITDGKLQQMKTSVIELIRKYTDVFLYPAYLCFARYSFAGGYI